MRVCRRVPSKMRSSVPSTRWSSMAGSFRTGSTTLTGRNIGNGSQASRFRQAKKEVNTVDLNGRRRSLTDPPVAYRAADAAVLDDLGEPELKKERRRKKEAQAAAQKNSSWWKPFQ